MIFLNKKAIIWIDDFLRVLKNPNYRKLLSIEGILNYPIFSKREKDQIRRLYRMGLLIPVETTEKMKKYRVKPEFIPFLKIEQTNIQLLSLKSIRNGLQKIKQGHKITETEKKNLKLKHLVESDLKKLTSRGTDLYTIFLVFLADLKKICVYQEMSILYEDLNELYLPFFALLAIKRMESRKAELTTKINVPNLKKEVTALNIQRAMLLSDGKTKKAVSWAENRKILKIAKKGRTLKLSQGEHASRFIFPITISNTFQKLNTSEDMDLKLKLRNLLIDYE